MSSLSKPLSCHLPQRPSFTPGDVYYMSLAVAQAERGRYTTRPNPAVGCVIVKSGQIVGQGYHPKAGEPHAEVFALLEAGDKAQGACAYVTLEPCSHTGKTPPCALALIKAKVARVVIAGLDPNPQVSGRGVKLLRDAGIEVISGVLQSQAEVLNKGFLKAMRMGRPYVRVKIASSLDGGTAMASGESKWITGAASREDVQTLRAMSGAIITGSQTVIADNPSLNVRSSQLGVALQQVPQPKVVILDRSSRLSAQSPYTVCQRPDTLFWREDNLEQLLVTLVKDYYCYDILVEAGAQVAGSFIQAGLVDELIVYQAPCFLGNEARSMVQLNIANLAEQRRFHRLSCEILGEDLKMIFQPL